MIWQLLCAVSEIRTKLKNYSSKQVRKDVFVYHPPICLTLLINLFAAVITRLSTFGDDHILTKCATKNLEYVINKKNSINKSSTGNKGKGKKVVVNKKVEMVKEEAGVKNEVKLLGKEVAEVEPDKDSPGTTAAEINASRMRNTKNINAREVVSTDVCC